MPSLGSTGDELLLSLRIQVLPLVRPVHQHSLGQPVRVHGWTVHSAVYRSSRGSAITPRANVAAWGDIMWPRGYPGPQMISIKWTWVDPCPNTISLRTPHYHHTTPIFRHNNTANYGRGMYCPQHAWAAALSRPTVVVTFVMLIPGAIQRNIQQESTFELTQA
jgi:hypothetical protein